MSDKKMKFNGMDLFIVIMIAAVAAAGVYLAFGRGGGGTGSGSSKNVEVTTVVELLGKDEDFAGKIKVGDVVAIGEKEKMMTNVKDIEVSVAKSAGYDILEGRVLRSDVEGERDIKITLVGEGAETDSTIEMNGAAIRIGQSAVLSSKNWAGQGFVIGLDTKEEK